MAKASDNVFPRFLISEGGSTTTPAAGRVTVYAKADGLLYQKDDAGTETLLAGAAGGSVATDAIWDVAGDLAVGSGANTAARLAKGAAGANLSQYNGVVGWNGGTSFPATPATGDRYWRSDLGREAYYDGTRWLTTQELSTHLAVSDVLMGTSNPPVIGSPIDQGPAGAWITRIVAWTIQTGGASATNYTTYQLSSISATNGATSVGGTFSTQNDTLGNTVQKLVTVGAVVTAADIRWKLTGTETLAPTGEYVDAEVFYRLILT